MAGTAFQTCPQTQQFVFADVRREALDPNDLGTSECDRSSLVDSHDVNFCELLKNNSAFQQDAALGSARNCRNYDKRSSKPEFGRRGEDHQGYDQFQVSGDREDCDQENQYNRDEPRCHAIRKLLNRCLARLRILHKGNYPRVERLLATLVHAHVQRAKVDNSTCKNLIGSSFLYRNTLSGNRCLINARVACRYRAVDGDAFASAYDNNLAELDVIDRYAGFVSIATHEGGTRNSPDKRLDRGTSSLRIEVRDKFGDQNDAEHDRAGNILSSYHGNYSSDRDEEFSSDFALAQQIKDGSPCERHQP